MKKLSSLIIVTIILSIQLYAIDNRSASEGEFSDLNLLLSDDVPVDTTNVSKSNNGASYLSESNNELANSTTDNTFEYETTPQYEDVAFRLFNRSPGGGISNQDWNGLKRKGMAQAVMAVRKGESRRQAEQTRQEQMRVKHGGKRDYNPNLFHWATWKCAADRLPWGSHKPENGQNSANCIEAIQVGW